MRLFFPACIQLTLLSPQIVAFGLVKGNDKSFLIQSMTLMIFKLYVHKSRFSCALNFNTFINWSK